MKAYRIELLVIDHDRLGAESIARTIEHTSYPNDCMCPQVQAIDGRDIGEWNDDHPLNRNSTFDAEYKRLFAPISAPTAAERRSIYDSEEFRILLRAYENTPFQSLKPLVGFIDTWTARSAVDAVPAVVSEALDIALDLAMAEADNVHTTYAGYKPHRHVAVDRDVETIKRAIDALNPSAAPAPGNTAHPTQTQKGDTNE